ncbi:UNVERIFIED_CONTAM: hypothetical protein Sradi_5133100 [Sesamum radiatum]|uniref:Pheromone receptor-like protein n=1 Tax=Sesamum radiatum TaxID=300843 RepID=A0AAW2M3T6_SESRA
MEVVIPSPSRTFDFDFNSARSSPHVSPPSTPKPFGDYYCSAPTSPSHLSQFYRDFDEFSVARNGSRRGGSWEPVKSSGGDDFAFDVSEDWESASVSADELFDGGVIKPLKTTPPLLHLPEAVRVSEHVMLEKPSAVSASPLSQTRKIIQGAFSPRRHKNSKEREPFLGKNSTRAAAGSQRGRERGGDFSKSSSRRAARSLSPLRDVQYPWEEEKEQPHNAKSSSSQSTLCSTLSTAPAKGGGYKKWRLKDFFLFRSASEGRASDKDPLKKYTAALRHSSFRSIDSPGSGSSRRRGPVSAHEMHYTMNRAVSEDLKKKTFLPYKQGILGRLAFNPAVHALANGFGFSRK